MEGLPAEHRPIDALRAAGIARLNVIYLNVI